mmetsp:Transcript_126482/g.247959  ORF Transcript_126482/g.247959 Transcript_126482/m.247959 type:complete len:210 (-) Transcript_126482:1016-1645(-)
MPPRSTTQEMPALFSLNSTSSSMAPNCEKTMHLFVASPCIIFWISSTKASIFVLLWNSEALMRCKIVLLPMPAAAAADCPFRPSSHLPSAAPFVMARAALCFPLRRRRGSEDGDTFSGVSQRASAGVADDEAPARPCAGVGVFGVLADAVSAFRLAGPATRLGAAFAFALPAPSPSSSSSSASSKSTTSFVKQVGQPTPPDGSLGASAT